jgi:hypothetical protein
VALAEIDGLVAAYENYERMVESWHRLEQHKAGQKVVIWGGGSKGMTFLNCLKRRIALLMW